jgi:hypothetical protein
MNQRVKLHMNVPQDVSEWLAAWATDNASSMTTELVRAVRERVAREMKSRCVEREQAERHEQVR